MDSLTLAEIHQSQLKSLTILRDFCQKYNLRYYLFFGSLLGAVRHNGFIPWDDDVDVVMPKDDYDFLIENFNKESVNNREVICKETNKEFYLSFAKIIDKNTVVIENGQTQKIGVWIDIFPLEYVIDDRKQLKKHNKKIGTINVLIKLLETKLRKGRALYKNIIILLSKVLLPFYKIFCKINKKHIDKIKSIVKTNTYGLFYRNFGIYGVPCIPNEYLEPSVTMLFENEYFIAPKEYDKILTASYSDYLKLPPKNKQISHHNYICYWNKDNI